MQIEQLEVRKDDLSKTQIVRREAPALQPDEVLLKVENFGLTANNITYGVVGEMIGYWKFFPAVDGWGIIPAWGIGEVIESKNDGLKKGERLYGYFPMASHLVMKAGKISPQRAVDVSEHRAGLPPVYNSYVRLSGEAAHDKSLDDARMVLFPLYATSYCLYDFLVDNKWFDAEQVIVISASSKTAIGLAYALKDDAKAPTTIGVTSPRNRKLVESLALYDSIAAYDRVADIANKPSVIVDMSGDGKFLTALHKHLGDNMRFCSNVGVTHYDSRNTGEGFIRERSQMFFAPGHIQKRASDRGPGEFEKRAYAFWREAAVKSRSWLKVERFNGTKSLQAIYHELYSGKVAPDRGIVAGL